MRPSRNLHSGKFRHHDISCRRDAADLTAIDLYVEIAAARLGQVVDSKQRDLPPNLAIGRCTKRRGCICVVRCKTYPAQSIQMIAASYEHRIARPAPSRVLSDSRVFVPAPRLVDEDESMSGIAKSELKLFPHRRCDSVIRNRGVAIVAYPCYALAGFRFAKSLIEVVEGVARRVLYLTSHETSPGRPQRGTRARCVRHGAQRARFSKLIKRTCPCGLINGPLRAKSRRQKDPISP